MSHLLRRSVRKGIGGLYLCRNKCNSAEESQLHWNEAYFNGVTVNLDQLGEQCSPGEFSVKLTRSIQQWRKEKKKSVWMKVPIVQSYLIPVAFEHGFSYHHAVGDHAMLLKWLPKKEHNKVPPYATHQVGVSGLVLNREKNEVLVVQDKNMLKIGRRLKRPVWKFPGGLSDEGESIEETAVREVWEETGIRAEFKSILLFRQQHKMKNAFDKSDVYVVCRMEPLSFGISHCEDEIAQCQWMELSTLLTHTDTTPLTKLAARLAKHGMKNGFESVDIVANSMRSWVNPSQTFSLFHRYMPS